MLSSRLRRLSNGRTNTTNKGSEHGKFRPLGEPGALATGGGFETSGRTPVANAPGSPRDTPVLYRLQKLKCPPGRFHCIVAVPAQFHVNAAAVADFPQPAQHF